MAKAGKAGIDLEAELDGLYAVPLAEFVNARDELAKRLGAAGLADDAARVKALKKPTPAAWAVNLLALTSPRLLRALAASGDRLRADPPAMKDAMRERRDVLNEARKAAEGALAGAGHAAGADVLRRVSATLEAIATYGSAGGAPAAGRLAEDVPAPGFDEVASLGILRGGAGRGTRPVPPPRPSRKAPQAVPQKRPSRTELERARRREDARRRDEKKRLAALRSEARKARAALGAAEKAADAARRRRSSLEAALSEAAAQEKNREAVLAAARRAAEAADAAEREARTRAT